MAAQTFAPEQKWWLGLGSRKGEFGEEHGTRPNRADASVSLLIQEFQRLSEAH
jgi:hypothetical protein